MANTALNNVFLIRVCFIFVKKISKKIDFFVEKFRIFVFVKKNLKTQNLFFAQIFSENFPRVLETIPEHLGAISGR